MYSSGIFVFLIVYISFADCLPPGNITHLPRRVVKFPQNTSSAVRTPSGGWSRDKNNTSRISNDEERFVFPEDDIPPPVIKDRVYIPTPKNQPPSCAGGSTFCERFDGYPGGMIENIFENELDEFKELQGTDELKSPLITQRIDGNATNEQPLCASVEKVVFPEVAKNKDDKWLYIVNTPSFVQGVRVEQCLKTSDNAEQSCFFNDSFPNGYKTVCTQKFIYRRMVAVNDEGKPYKDTFWLPSCCSCKVVAVGAMFRQGGLRKAIRTTVPTTIPPKH